MIKKAYFVFPEHEDQFYLLGDDSQTYEEIVKTVFELRQFVRENHDFELWYDSKNLKKFLDHSESLVGGEYLANVKKQVTRIFGRDVLDIQGSPQWKEDCVYMRLMSDFTFQDTYLLLREATENSIDVSATQPLLFSFGGAIIDDGRDTLSIVKEAHHLNDMPILFRIPIFQEVIGLQEWTSSHTGGNIFALRDKTVFKLTGKRWKQQSIYYHIEDNQYWYYDFFHKDNKQHYEVFNAVGDHLGEADLKGTMIPGTADANKKIGDIIK